MLDYVQNLSDFLPGVEAEIAKQTKGLLSAPTDRGQLLCIYALMELADNLESMDNVSREKVISYLLDKFNIIEAEGIAFGSFDLTQIGSGGKGGGPVHWNDILGKPIPVSDIDQKQLTEFIKNNIPAFELYYLKGGNASGKGFHPAYR